MVAETDFNKLLAQQAVVHKRRIRDVDCYITQARDNGARSQFLCLILHDTYTDRFIVLKLSTMRKIIKWIVALSLGKARKLTCLEKWTMDRRSR
jgi:hypothetical protein